MAHGLEMAVQLEVGFGHCGLNEMYTVQGVRWGCNI